MGDLRFRRPEAAPGWKGTLDATRWVQCTQVQPLLELTTEGQEDCLVLNVYTPRLPGETKGEEEGRVKGLAVMVWIHGGGFWFGSGADFRPNFAMDHDIVGEPHTYVAHKAHASF